MLQKIDTDYNMFTGPNIIKDGLVFALDAANTKSYPGSGTTWNDLSGNGNNGTLVNNVTYDNNNNGSLLFDATNERVDTNITSFGNNTTWVAWVNRASTPNYYNMFMGRLLPYFGLTSDNGIIFSNIIGGSQQTVFASSISSSNVWLHLSFTTNFNGTNTVSSIYLNGVSVSSNTFSGSQGSHSGVFTIGEGRSTGGWYPFNGRVSMVQIYDRTLTTEEILQNFNATKSRFEL
jgi:hypothetical protein